MPGPILLDRCLTTLMSSIFILISVSLLVASGFLIAFIRAAKNGQFNDSYTPSVRMLFDDELVSNKEKQIPATKQEQNKTTTNV
jgi:cbb3-type cytochrome oxidase maturation protein